MNKARVVVAALLVAVAAPGAAHAQAGSDADLAKKLANPISSLISVPLQYNFDCCFGPAEAERHLLNIQPVIPTKLNPNWNLIVRTILPVVYLQAPAVGLDDAFGLSDTLQSFFFSPSNTPGGITWGIGPRHPVANRDRSTDRQRQVGCRSHRGDPETAVRLDLWRSCQSDLVLRRRWRTQR